MAGLHFGDLKAHVSMFSDIARARAQSYDAER